VVRCVEARGRETRSEALVPAADVGLGAVSGRGHYAACVQLTIVVHYKDFELYLNDNRLKCRMQDALLRVSC
jgi:hypothetical protein